MPANERADGPTVPTTGEEPGDRTSSSQSVDTLSPDGRGPPLLYASVPPHCQRHRPPAAVAVIAPHHYLGSASLRSRPAQAGHERSPIATVSQQQSRRKTEVQAQRPSPEYGSSLEPTAGRCAWFEALYTDLYPGRVLRRQVTFAMPLEPDLDLRRRRIRGTYRDCRQPDARGGTLPTRCASAGRPRSAPRGWVAAKAWRQDDGRDTELGAVDQSRLQSLRATLQQDSAIGHLASCPRRPRYRPFLCRYPRPRRRRRCRYKLGPGPRQSDRPWPRRGRGPEHPSPAYSPVRGIPTHPAGRDPGDVNQARGQN